MEWGKREEVNEEAKGWSRLHAAGRSSPSDRKGSTRKPSSKRTEWSHSLGEHVPTEKRRIGFRLRSLVKVKPRRTPCC